MVIIATLTANPAEPPPSQTDITQDNGFRGKDVSISSVCLSSHLFLTFLHASLVRGTKAQVRETWMQLKELGCAQCHWLLTGELLAVLSN